ncbi:MAG: antibiotic biosynthesis monooxygenase [Sandaracinaceae bacterium]|nr:antibiotic biosynthesis monooxygenase [Myxococcales bacterium]MCB9657390.1 antibiotic biosynthesis monooxygenase [Sandaracinaceae bacterium]
MLTHSLIVRLTAKPDRADEVAAFLAGAQPLAVAEDFTPVWFAFRADETTFYIVDAFASESARTRHLEGAIAAALMAKADDLLATPPVIERASVLGAKVTV